MKISVIGGGGVRSMFLAKSLVQKAGNLGITDIVFMDNNEKKLNIYGKMSAQVAKRLDDSVRFTITTSAEEAVKDADYIITTIRVGEDEMRIRDETLALELGILGQETTGAAGFSFAMRSIPALVEYCELAKKLAKPNMKLFNFTNPAGVVSQTLRDMGYDFTYGICDAPSGMLRSFAQLYGADPELVTGECYGLNHLSFFKNIYLDGRDIMPELLEKPELYEKTEMRFFQRALVKHVGCILNEYLYYFYYRQEAVDHILKAGITRGEVIRDINLHMTEELAEMDIENDFDRCLEVFEHWYGKRAGAYMANETGIKNEALPFRFDIYEKDTGGYAGVALKYIEAELSGKNTEMILCVPNNGAIDGLKDSDVVEITCTVGKDCFKPHKIVPDPVPFELIKRVKAYERLASEAIRERSRKAAIDCLMVHPLVNSYSFAAQLADEYIASNSQYSEGWK